MLEDFDKQVSILTEAIARKFHRRQMVGTTVKGLFATVAAATVGQLANVGQAFAATTCTCDEGWTTGHRCSYWGHPCPYTSTTATQCPSGCSTCYSPGCNGWCSYSSGHWVSCSGLGTCGKGYKLCWDCKCPD